MRRWFHIINKTVRTVISACRMILNMSELTWHAAPLLCSVDCEQPFSSVVFSIVCQNSQMTGMTVNQHYCKQVLIKLRGSQKTPTAVKKNGFILHQDNGTTHTTFCKAVFDRHAHYYTCTSSVFAWYSAVQILFVSKSYIGA